MKFTLLTMLSVQFRVLNTFTPLCNRHPHPSPDLVPSCKTEILCPLNSNSPFLTPCPPEPLATTILLSNSGFEYSHRL